MSNIKHLIETQAVFIASEEDDSQHYNELYYGIDNKWELIDGGGEHDDWQITAAYDLKNMLVHININDCGQSSLYQFSMDHPAVKMLPGRMQ